MREAPDQVHNQHNEGTQQHEGQAKNQDEPQGTAESRDVSADRRGWIAVKAARKDRHVSPSFGTFIGANITASPNTGFSERADCTICVVWLNRNTANTNTMNAARARTILFDGGGHRSLLYQYRRMPGGRRGVHLTALYPPSPMCPGRQRL